MQRDILIYQRKKILSLLGICFCMLIIISLCTNYKVSYEDISNMSVKNQKSYLTNSTTNVNDGYIYLSDIPYIKSQSSSAWKNICLDKTIDGTSLSVKVEGAYYTFEKGIWAHATSTLVYDLSNYQDYEYFTVYMGLNRTAASSSNGVKFYVYTSKDGSNWDLKTSEDPEVAKPGANSLYVKINIKGAKYLKLYANDNGSNGNDHAVYADAKLLKGSYKDEMDELVIDIKDYDNKIKTEYANANLDNKEYELLLLQREFVNNVGNYALKKFLKESDLNKEVYSWLINDLDNLRLYVMGGTPDGGNYYNSLKVLSKLYEEYSNDFENTELLGNKWYPNMTYGYLYKKMAFSISLTHSQLVGLWMQSNNVVNQSEPLRRYAIFKYLHKNGKFKATKSLDITPWFESLQVEEMRLVLNNNIDDEEILWLNQYVQSHLDKYQTTNYLTPHPYMAYVWPNYQNPVYYAEENVEYFNELFAVNGVGLFDLKYTIPGGKNIKSYDLSITRGTSDNKIYKVWMNFRNKFGTGAVCGGISKSGTNIRTTHGIPAVVIGQPGHAAILYYTKNEQGKGYWNIDNDVSGWTLSEKGERMLNGWGNASYSRGYSVVYMVLAQEALNDYENYEKSQKTLILADVYNGNTSKQEEIYRKALKTQSINIDAWYGLINLYLSDKTKTEKDYYNLAEELAENLKDFPLPMYHLTNLIKPKLTSTEYSFKFTLLQTRILTEGSNSTSTKVLQPGVTKIEAKYLLGQLDTNLSSFSFDGEDAGKIVLSSRYDQTGVRLDYSIDGKQTWNEVSFTADEDHKILLTSEQLDSITSENDIYVHIIGTSYDENNLYKIDILEQAAPSNIYNNDLENEVIGATENMEWRMEGSDAWTSFKYSKPDLTGDKTVIVRNKKTGVYLTSAERVLKFTEDIIDEKRKYISISKLSIQSVSSEATAQDRYAKYAIDGNINTTWHSAWNGSDTNRYIVIQIDNPVYLTALDYKASDGGNGILQNAQILVSMDAENWTEVVSETNWANNSTIKTINFDESIRAKYVKIVGKKTSTTNGKSYMTAAMINLYEDATKQILPTASIDYSTRVLTNKDVIVKLTNPSTKIIITNNDGKDSYTFKENGRFTFEFVDEDGNKGSETAIVSNIDKIVPTATIKYSINEQTHNPVVATLENESEPIIILNNDGKREYTFTSNGKFEFTYKDKAGNIGKTVATVNFIIPDNNEITNQNPSQVVDSNIDNTNNTILKSDVVLENNSNQKINSYESNNIKQDVSNDEITYETYSNGIFSIKVPSNIIFNEKIILKLDKLKLNNSLNKKLKGQSKYFELYFENENKEKLASFDASMKLTIKLGSNKKLIGIYEVENNEIKELNYTKLEDNMVELDIDKLNKYIISYEKEVNEIKDNKKGNKSIILIVFGIIIVISIIISKVYRRK